MFLHLGENTVITTNEIIGIFDMDNTTVSKITRDYLSSMQKNKRIVDVSFDLPKSFILCKNKETGEDTVYISPISTQTLLKRIQTNKGFEWDCQFKTVLFFKDYVFTYYGTQAVHIKAATDYDWKKSGLIYWQGKEIKRDSKEYEMLVDELYISAIQNPIYRGILSNCNKFIIHSIGENNKKDTTFTRYEFEFELNCLKDFIQKKYKKEV